MKKYKAILFDFDNTIIDSGNFAKRYANEFLDKHPQIKTDAAKILKDIFVDDSENYSTQIKNEFNSSWVKYRELNPIKTFLEDKDTLKQLYQKGIKLGIISRSRKEIVLRNLEKNNIIEYFEVIIGNANKPEPSYLIDALKTMNISKSDALFIGDDPEDIELGNNCNVDTAYILRNNDHAQSVHNKIKDLIYKNNPTYVISDLTKLLDTLN